MIKKFFTSLSEEFSEILFAASSLAYSTLLSIVPFLVVVLAVFQMGVGLETFYPKIEVLFTTYLKEATGSLASDYIKAAISTIKPKTMGITGLLLLLFTSLGLIRNIDTAFHRMWKMKINRPLYRRVLFYWIILLAVPVCLALVVGLRSASYFNHVSESIEDQFMFSIWTTLFLWLMFTIIPNVKVKVMASLPPAILVSIALNIVQSSFIWASLKVFRKNKIYGSLASFPIFLLWLLVVWCVILCGVSLCSFLQQKILKRP
ncbi:MAG: hypothetical protein A2622_01970 [Bdellovibrionales bacterium RIFCSPHIGHO2_01_FULL_40_29]|nr:MAG: hypothetical protein A2622_01970 [Bdellovibrionales bacterium RIFCSPHIGHO2_01_FULL_40_29]OFZ33857.1 MAG: hypothetical protein A3D17_02390 [Bdellovibrionales bacterium RIFCSPHIGHO2_02_FULL_40_15]